MNRVTEKVNKENGALTRNWAGTPRYLSTRTLNACRFKPQIGAPGEEGLVGGKIIYRSWSLLSSTVAVWAEPPPQGPPTSTSLVARYAFSRSHLSVGFC
jgi:hypothetical protein